MLHQLDAKGHKAKQGGRIQNQAKTASQRDLTSLDITDITVLHEAQMQGQHLEKYLK